MGHLWGIEVEILVKDGDLVAVLLSHPFAINAEYHLCICVPHLTGNETIDVSNAREIQWPDSCNNS